MITDKRAIPAVQREFVFTPMATFYEDDMLPSLKEYLYILRSPPWGVTIYLHRTGGSELDNLFRLHEIYCTFVPETPG